MKRTKIAAAFALSLSLAFANIAEATPAPAAAPPAETPAEGGLLAPSTRAGFAYGSIGFSAGTFVNFNILAGGGYHFRGNSTGPALGGELQLNIAGGVGLLPAVRFGWDIQIAQLPLYLSPGGRLGVLIIPGNDQFPTMAFFNIQPSLDVKFVLGNRGLLFARPVGLDFLIGENFGFTYQFLVGGGVTF